MNVVVHGVDAELRTELVLAIHSLGYRPIEAQSLDDVRHHAGMASVILIDLAEAGADATVEALRTELPEVGLVVLGNDFDPRAALEALREGAHAFLRKPFRVETLSAALQEAGGGATRASHSAGFVARHPSSRRAREILGRAAGGDAAVLIRGVAGTGKSHAARWLHEAGSRRHAPFIVIDAQAPELADASDPQPSDAPAAPFARIEAAQGGTCLIENVDALGPELQSQLSELLHTRRLRTGRERPGVNIDVRFVATTREDLALRTEEGRFSRELFYQLDVIAVFLPPLRERPSDIPILADLFLDRIAGAEACARPELDGDALRALAELPLEGNLRELEMLMRRAVLLAPGERVDVAALEEVGPPRAPATRPAESTFDLRALERDTIARALRAAQGNRTAAARSLGISVRTLRNKIHRYAL